MKTPFLFLAACLTYGCSSPEQSNNSDSRFSDLSKAPQPFQTFAQPAPVAKPAPRGKAPELVFVRGDFNNAQYYNTWSNGMTLQGIITASGGFKAGARKRITLTHWDGTREEYRWSAEQPLTNNPVLKPGDTVWGPIHDLP